MNTLATQSWIPVRFDEVVLSWLKAEWRKWAPLAWTDDRIVCNADLANPVENAIRVWLLTSIRGPLLHRLPVPTEWFSVAHLRNDHLHQLRIIGRCGLDDPSSDANELMLAARRIGGTLQAAPDAWQFPVLWGHAKEQPLTILEGNHRLAAYVLAPNLPQLQVVCYAGLSADKCFWHLPDPP